MAVGKDWVAEAVNEIIEVCDLDPSSAADLIPIIERHCPFERGVLYEPIGSDSHKLDILLAICTSIKEKF